MSETGTKDWLVKAVRVGKTEPNPHGGEFQKFYVDFEGSPDTYWRRKGGDTPEVGRSYYGNISEGNYGPIFKKEKPLEGHTGSFEGSRNYGGGKRDWQPESERDPERVARILRQHSQEMAIRIFAATSNGEMFNVADVAALADELDQDVIEAGRKAAQGAGAARPGDDSHVASPAPAQDPGVHQRLSTLLEGAGVNSAAARLITDYLLSERSTEEQDAAIERLQNPNMAPACVKRFSELAEQHYGEPLPTAAPDDDIPF